MKEIFLAVFLLNLNGPTGTLVHHQPFYSLSECTAVVQWVTQIPQSALPEGGEILNGWCITKETYLNSGLVTR